MEKIRKFERACLRNIFGKYRKSDSKYFVSNQELYNIAKIPRIDNFILQLTREYYNSLKTNNNKIIYQFTKFPDHLAIDSAKTNYIPPEAFIYFDKIGVIQNDKNVPIIYHISRHRANKSIPDNFDSFCQLPLVYSTSIPDQDQNDFSRINNNYWWLHKDARHLAELRHRKRNKSRNN